MADYNSKRTGEQIEALLDIVQQGGSGEVEKTTEAEITAMGFTKNIGTITEVKMNGASKGTSGVVDLGTVITAHQDISGKQDVINDLATIREGASKGATALQSIPAEYVTESELTAKGYATTSQLGDKVDKVSGKGLSTNDFTTALKTKLEGLSNYDDTAINSAVTTLRSDFDKLVSGDSTTAIKTFNEIIAFLDGIADSESLDSIISSIEQQIAGKQATISDLATIRSGAAKGATAVQPADISEFLTVEDIAAVATTGRYEDLVNKPTIPSAVTESTVSGWGFTKNTGTYSKPSGGIPKSDLASAVQTSLGKADTAQDLAEDLSSEVSKLSEDKQDKLVSGTNIKTINGTSILGSGNISISGGSGTITGVSANGTSVATSGVANIPAASTSAYGVTKLSSSTSSTSTTLAATASAVKSAYDLANSYKGTVTGVKVNGSTKSPSSGTVDIGNVVTSVKVNGSIYSPSSGVVDLGTISGGGSSGGGSEYAGNYPIFRFTNNTSSLAIQPNTFTIPSYTSTKNITLGSPSNNDIVNEYIFVWYSSPSANSLSLPSSIIWANNDVLIPECGNTYIISIVDNVAAYIKVEGNIYNIRVPSVGGDN